MPVKQEYRTYKTHLTRKEVKRVLRKGLSYRAGARELGVSVWTFLRAIESMKLPLRGRVGKGRSIFLTAEQLEPFIRGYTWETLASMFNCSVTAIKANFKRQGIIKRDERIKNRFVPTL